MKDGWVFFRQVEGLRLSFEKIPQQRFAEPFGFQENALVHLFRVSTARSRDT